MTVYIEKPAVNLREELASLRNQGGYQEQQFYFDGLVTNGTFDAGTTGWTGLTATLSVVVGRFRVANSGTNFGFSYQGFATTVGQTYTYSLDVFVGTDDAVVRIADNSSGATNQKLNAIVTSDSTLTGTFVATAPLTYIRVGPRNNVNAEYAEFDNISVFETDGTDVIHRLPKGWKPKDVFEDGLLQREGAAHDYEVIYDGFDYVIKPAVAPSATTQTCVIGVKA